MGLREGFIDRVVSRIDRPAQVKLHWRARLRAGSLHAQAMSQLVRPGDTAIDVGANWGLYTVGLSELVGPDGHVIAVEPGPALVTLRAACARSANVTVNGIALSDRCGTGNLVIGDAANTAADAMAHIVDGAPTGQTFTEVPLARLDDLEIPNRSRLSFVKCDVEGHEDAVLRGAEGTIRELLPALLVEIEERHRDHPMSDAFELLTSWGYAGFALTETGLRPLERFDMARDQRDHLINGELPIPTPPGYVNDFLFVRHGVRPPSVAG